MPKRNRRAPHFRIFAMGVSEYKREKEKFN